MNVVETLNSELLEHFPDDKSKVKESLNIYKQLALFYAKTENAIAVLSDLYLNKSYIYWGGIASKLSVSPNKDEVEISSIWEDEILNTIHPEDLLQKHLLELRFFHFRKQLPAFSRKDFHIISKLRMRNRDGQFIPIQHRMFYLSDKENGNPGFALCLYNHNFFISDSGHYDGFIFNSATGEILDQSNSQSETILSKREKEVLSMIRHGKNSNEISEALFISKNTVNRHRQNILEKLQVNNSMEACRIAELMNLF